MEPSAFCCECRYCNALVAVSHAANAGLATEKFTSRASVAPAPTVLCILLLRAAGLDPRTKGPAARGVLPVARGMRCCRPGRSPGLRIDAPGRLPGFPVA